MFLKEISGLPTRGERKKVRANNKLKTILLDFYNSSMDFAEVGFMHGEYSSSASLYSGLRKAMESMEDLPISVEFIQGGIYLRRTD